MIRELILRERFLDSLLEIETYLSQFIGSKSLESFPTMSLVLFLILLLIILMLS
jgi:hypothetical protein